MGAAGAPKPPLPKPPFVVVLAPQGSSVGAETGGALTDGDVLAAGAGSGVAQASLEPQASLFEKPEKVLEVADDGIGAGFG